MEKDICLIAAVADNRVIGYRGNIPWPKLPGDMKRFVDFTKDQVVIMGRKTYESIGKRLKDRTNIVVSRNPSFGNPGVEAVASDIDAAIGWGKREIYSGNIWIIGGGEIYAQTMHLAKRLEITEVHAEPNGDSYFPKIRGEDWIETERKDFQRKGEIPPFSFVSYVRR
jgi:dihydrofolate reductase